LWGKKKHGYLKFTKNPINSAARRRKEKTTTKKKRTKGFYDDDEFANCLRMRADDTITSAAAAAAAVKKLNNFLVIILWCTRITAGLLGGREGGRDGCLRERLWGRGSLAFPGEGLGNWVASLRSSWIRIYRVLTC
jgi:hypothetical protein